MAKVGLTLSRADMTAPVAEHFGKAKWLLVVESPERCTFSRNVGLNGRSVVEELASRGCTDLVARRMGPGAYARATPAGMRVWEAGEAVTARDAVDRLAARTLRPLAPASEHEDHHGARHHLSGRTGPRNV